MRTAAVQGIRLALLMAALSMGGCGSASMGEPGHGSGGATASGGAGSGGTATGGNATGGKATGGTNTGGSAGATPAGTGGAGVPADPPLVDISGRWGMFTFEDPVGVQLFQAPDGKLTGTGCFSGTPGSPRFGVTTPVLAGSCGKITGEVRSRSASFGFTFAFGGDIRYSTRVTISDDGRRMAGVFNNGTGDLQYPIAWLRVADDADWLKRTSLTEPDQPAFGPYQLTLVAADSQGDEFDPGKTYLLTYTRDAIWGHFGSFWNSEMTRDISAPDGAVRVGPVPPTTPDLPILLEFGIAGGALRSVTASTVTGGRYTFTAVRWQP